MIGRNCSIKLGFVTGIGAAALALALSACAGGQQSSAASNGSASEGQVAMNFDLNACRQLGPNLYQCPGSDKPICDPGYNKGDVDCIRVDKNGVLIRQGM